MDPKSVRNVGVLVLAASGVGSLFFPPGAGQYFVAIECAVLFIFSVAVSALGLSLGSAFVLVYAYTGIFLGVGVVNMLVSGLAGTLEIQASELPTAFLGYLVSIAIFLPILLLVSYIGVMLGRLSHCRKWVAKWGFNQAAV